VPSPDKPPQKYAGGRPRKPIDLKLVASLAHIQCTDAELAACLGFTEEGFRLRKKADEELLGVIQKGKEEGRMSLRRMQYQGAQSGDRTMLVWLGKQYLGQTDIQRHELSGVEGGPIETKTGVSIEHLDDADVEALERIAERTAKRASSA